jgi:hypothetical protein
VIVLDHLVAEQTSTRRLRVLKYRGSLHGTNEYPFLIGENGISVQPITSLGLQHQVSSERVSTGVHRLDAMLGGEGPYRGSSLLISGPAGTGKSTLAAHFCDAACRNGQRAIYFAFEESQDQIVRNMSSVGLDLARWIEEGLLLFRCVRPSLLGLEAHLAAIQGLVDDFDPAVVVLDPIADLVGVGNGRDVSAMLTRLRNPRTGGHAEDRSRHPLRRAIDRARLRIGVGRFRHRIGQPHVSRANPVQYLKIDIGFVRDVVRSRRGMFVVRAIVALAADLGQQTIAEGVEDEQTAHMLGELGVTFAQGYLFGRPEQIPGPRRRGRTLLAPRSSEARPATRWRDRAPE